jgi:hypothetical protein
MPETQDAPLSARCNVKTELVTTIRPTGKDPGLRVDACPKCGKHEVIEFRSQAQGRVDM